MFDKIKVLFGKKTPIVNEPKNICKKRNDVEERSINIATNEMFSIDPKKERIPQDNLYRLHYIYIEKGKDYIENESLEIVDWVFPIFKIPNNITEEELFILISYLYKTSEINKMFSKWESTIEINSLLEKTNIEFQPNDTIKMYIPKELYIIDGDINVFRNSKYYQTYITWFQETMEIENIKKICEKCGLSIGNINLNMFEKKLSYFPQQKNNLSKKNTYKKIRLKKKYS